MKKRVSLKEKGSLIPIIINILVILLSGVIPIFLSEFSAITYIILIPILFIVLGVLTQIKNRNIFILAIITLIPLGVLMFLGRGLEILVYLVFYMTAVGVAYLITAITRNVLKEYSKLYN